MARLAHRPKTQRRAFWWDLGAIALVALAVRIGLAFLVDSRMQVSGDGVWYVGIARLLPRGFGFIEPLQWGAAHVRMETASHPPVVPLFLSIMDWLGLHSLLAHRLWSCGPGTITVVAVGLTGREVAGDRGGLLAAAAAAVSVSLAVSDVLLWSEGLYATTIAVVLFLSYRFLKNPRTMTAVGLTVAITFSALTRAEASLLYVLLLVPLLMRVDKPIRQRVGITALCALVVVGLLAPWTVYNSERFESPVVLSTGFGGLLGSSNCDITYSGPLIGSWGNLCARGLPDPLPRDETKVDALTRAAGWKYVSGHLDRLPAVLSVRVLRTFGFWDPVNTTASDLQFGDIGVRRFGFVAVGQYWLFLALGVSGAISLRRRRVPLLPLVAPVILVMAITIVGYGTPRFRTPVDVALTVAVGALARVDRRYRSPAEPSERASGIVSA